MKITSVEASYGQTRPVQFGSKTIYLKLHSAVTVSLEDGDEYDDAMSMAQVKARESVEEEYARFVFAAEERENQHRQEIEERKAAALEAAKSIVEGEHYVPLGSE